MRKQFIFLLPILAFGLFLTSCRDTIEPGGEPITEEFFLDRFDGFTINGNFEVLLSQGPEQRVFVTAPPDILDIIDTRVRQGHWIIDYNTSVRNASKTIIEIVLPDIREIIIDGTGDVIAQNYLELGHLDILIDGPGDIELFGEANTQNITIDGSGDVHNFDLVTYETRVTVQGSGDTEVTAEDILDVRIDGSGNVAFRGFPELFIEGTGSGEVIDAN